jgi:enoyl-CoA hydratase/carnithine racemase
MDTAMEYAREISENAPLAVQAAKELAIRSREVDRTTGLRLEASMNRLLQFTQDAVEGPAAFAEKRPPNFSGR